MIDQLNSPGIEKGKPFAPDAAMKQILAAAAREAHAWLAAKYDVGLPTFFERTHWSFPAQPIPISSSRHRRTTTRRPVSGRLARACLSLCLYRPQTARGRAVLSHQHQGQGRRELRRVEDLPPARAAECADRAVLVADRLRPGDPRAHQEHDTRQSGLECKRREKECGRIGGPLPWT